MGGFETILVHYGSRAVLLVGFFLVRKLAGRRRRRSQFTESYNILSGSDVQPVNSRILHLWTADMGPEDLVVCPLVHEYLVRKMNQEQSDRIGSVVRCLGLSRSKQRALEKL